MLNETLITIAVPTFNRADSLRDTLASISKGLNLLSEQQRQKIQIMVSNNASTDKTREVCLSFENLTYIEQPKNLGYDENICTLYNRACGTWIFFLSDDDIFEYTALPALINLLERSCQLDVIFCNWYSLTLDGSKKIHTHARLLQKKGEFNFNEVCKLTPFYFLSSFVLRRAPIKKSTLLRGTYATQMEIALEVLSRQSRCKVLNDLIVGRMEPTTELIGGNSDASISWRIHIGFTNVRRKYQKKFGIELSPVAELSSALSSWAYVKNSERPKLKRLSILLVAILHGVAHTKPFKLIHLPTFILQKYWRIRQ